MPSVNFFNEGISFTLKHKTKIRHWLKSTIESEGYKLGHLNFIYCDDEYVLRINIDYLNHNTYTDIITFDASVVPNVIQGDIFISMDRVLENSIKYNVHDMDELHRVMIHGTLHLLGYKDKTRPQKKLMSLLENKYLSLRGF